MSRTKSHPAKGQFNGADKPTKGSRRSNLICYGLREHNDVATTCRCGWHVRLVSLKEDGEGERTMGVANGSGIFDSSLLIRHDVGNMANVNVAPVRSRDQGPAPEEDQEADLPF